MSLVGFKAENHPQQVGARGALDGKDDRATSPEVFEPLHQRFGFALDVAASPANAKCAEFYAVEDDGLEQSWSTLGAVWCNPPYSDIRPWVEKAWREWYLLDFSQTIVLLLPANRTEQGWWQDLVEPHLREHTPGFSVEFLRGRLRFIQAGRTEIGPNERPPFGCCLLIWQPPTHP